MTNQAVTLWIPGLLDHFQPDHQAWWSGSAFQTLLNKADVYPLKPYSFIERASQLFHQPQTLSAAATMASVELTDFDPQAFWLKVDPVQMIPDRDTLVLVSAQDLDITQAESQALLDAFNQHFAQDGVKLEWGANDSWYMHLPQAVDLQTTDLAQANYRNLHGLYPSGHAGAYWRTLMNEVQMLFYQHPVNLARRELGQAEINSVWVWGEGQVKLDNIQMRPQAKIWGHHAYLKGLANLAQAQFEKPPSDHQAWCLDRAQQAHFITLDLKPLMESDIETTDNQLLLNLEKDWMQGLLEDLKQGRIHSLFIDLGGTKGFLIEPSHLRRFWRRWRNPLKS